MKFIIHYELDGVEDFFTVEGENEDSILAQVTQFLVGRGTDAIKANVWSEKI